MQVGGAFGHHQLQEIGHLIGHKNEDLRFFVNGVTDDFVGGGEASDDFAGAIFAEGAHAHFAGAIAQVTHAALHGVPLGEAIEAPRLHVDADGILHLEGGFPGVAPDGWPVVRWAGRNLFFGGVSAVEREPDGTYSAAGDPRRGGCGIVVP